MPTWFNSARLLELRLDHGFTQDEVAKAIGVDVTTYRAYESGRVNRAAEGFEVRRLRRRNILLSMVSLFELSDVAELLVDRVPPQPLPHPSDPSLLGLALLALALSQSAKAR